MQEILNKVQSMTEVELQELMDAIQQRYTEAYPEWEVLYLSLHRDPALRQEEVKELLDFLNHHPRGNFLK